MNLCDPCRQGDHSECSDEFGWDHTGDFIQLCSCSHAMHEMVHPESRDSQSTTEENN